MNGYDVSSRPGQCIWPFYGKGVEWWTKHGSEFITLIQGMSIFQFSILIKECLIWILKQNLLKKARVRASL